MKTAFTFRHGLGDCVMFSIVLRHLQHYYPYNDYSIASRPGTQSIFHGLVENAWVLKHPHFWRDGSYDVKDVSFHAPNKPYNASFPSTKAAKCILEMGMEPIPDFFYYDFPSTEEAVAVVDRFREEIGGCKYGVIHGYGNARREQKDFNDIEIEGIIDQFNRAGLKAVLLDWRSEYDINEKPQDVIRPAAGHYLWYGKPYGDAAAIKELIAGAEVFYGVDSGPGHIAGATNTPSYIFWFGTNPMFCYDSGDAVTHLVDDTSPLENAPHAKELYDIDEDSLLAKEFEKFEKAKQFMARFVQLNLYDFLPAKKNSEEH